PRVAQQQRLPLPRLTGARLEMLTSHRLLCPHREIVTTRRDFLCKAGGGFGALALASLLQAEAAAASGASDPQAPKKPHHPARAKSVIFLFMEGGPSGIDLFDPKPLLDKLAGKSLPPSFGTVITSMGEQDSPLLALPRKWKQHGQSGI